MTSAIKTFPDWLTLTGEAYFYVCGRCSLQQYNVVVAENVVDRATREQEHRQSYGKTLHLASYCFTH